MATSTLADVALTATWVDLVVTHASLASADATLMNAGRDPIAIVFGGTDPSAAGKSGIVIGPRQTVTGNAAAVWARSLAADGKVAVVLNAGDAGSAPEVQGNIASGTAEAGNPVAVAGIVASGPGVAGANGTRQELKVDDRGYLWVNVGAGGGSAIGTAGVPGGAVVSVQGVASGTPQPVSVGPTTSGGLSIARLIASAGANIKAAAGQVYGGTFTNSNAAIRYLHLYNKASAATLSTDTPVITIPLPPNATVQMTTDGLGAAFATGISWTFTTDDIAIPTTAGATTDIHGTLFYK